MMRKIKGLALVLVLILVVSACTSNSKSEPITSYDTWEELVKAGSGKEVTILMWGGNEGINQYMDTFVADHLKEMYDITLNRVPMGASDYLAKLINEKKNNIELGTADLLWINAENFRTAKEGGLLSGPFTDLLNNQKSFYDLNADDLAYDSGVPIEGYEGIWGRAQLVLTYDEARLQDPPRNFTELKQWVKDNPGRFTYPKLPDDFVGTAFVRTAYYELTGERDKFQEDLTLEEFAELSKPVMDYFNEIAPYLWEEGKAYPATQAQQDDLFKNGEIDITMGFEVGKTSGLIASGVYPETVKTFVFDTGTIGNSHYLAIPFNSPEQAAAVLVIDFLESPLAQLEKMNPKVWGDMPAFDVSKISAEQQTLLETYEDVPGAVSLEDLTSSRLPEMKATYIDWIKQLWVESIK
jgi:putative spermidine/putrescine transport system substrate-binding protein